MASPTAQGLAAPPSASPSLRASAPVAAVALALLAIAFALVGRLAPVVERGALVPSFPGYEVERVRVLGLEWIVDVSTSAKDLLTALVLLAVATLAWRAARGLPRATADARAFRLLAAVAAFAGVDEAAALHETLGHNLAALGGLPAADRPDDLLMVLYGVAGLVLVRRFLPLARRARGALAAFGASGTAVAGAILIDFSTLRGGAARVAEESLEGLGAALLAVGLVLLQRHRRRTHPRPADERRARPSRPGRRPARAPGRSS